MNQQDSQTKPRTHVTKWFLLIGVILLVGIAMYQTRQQTPLNQKRHEQVEAQQATTASCTPALLSVQPTFASSRNAYFRFGKIPKPSQLSRELKLQSINGQFKKIQQTPGYTGPNVFIPITHTLDNNLGRLTFQSLISFTQKSQIWVSKYQLKMPASAGSTICRFISDGQASFQMNMRMPLDSVRGVREDRVIMFDVTYKSGCPGDNVSGGRNTNLLIQLKSRIGKDYKMVICDDTSCKIYAVVSTYRLVRDLQRQNVRRGDVTPSLTNLVAVDVIKILADFLEKDYLDVLSEQASDAPGEDDDDDY